MMVTIWLVLVECDATHSEQDCILALGDNTAAIGWLFKSGKLQFDSPYYTAVQLIARRLARLITASSHCLASQHIKGDKNTVSDHLSFAGETQGDPHPLAPDYPSDFVLTERFHSSLPQLVPPGFNISPLPNEISCFIIQAITPKFLRTFCTFLSTVTSKSGDASTLAHVADLVLGAFFFAMRSCEYTKLVSIGRTKRVRLGCFVFRTASRRVLLHSDPKRLHHAECVTIVFEDQKNGKKMDARPQVPLPSTTMGIRRPTNNRHHPWLERADCTMLGGSRWRHCRNW
jgi:hypothetical protein